MQRLEAHPQLTGLVRTNIHIYIYTYIYIYNTYMYTYIYGVGLRISGWSGIWEYIGVI